MAEYYCHACSVARGLIAGPPAGETIASTYQAGKHAKHTTPSTSVPVQGVWANSSTGFYRDRVVDALDRGFIECDDHGRKNVICPTTEHTGWRFEYGAQIRDTDSISVVLSTSTSKMHAFPVNSSEFDEARCKMCGNELFG